MNIYFYSNKKLLLFFYIAHYTLSLALICTRCCYIKNWLEIIAPQCFRWLISFFPHENDCKWYKKLTSRLCLVLYYTYQFFLILHNPLLRQNKKLLWRCFPEQVRSQTIVQLYVFQYHSSVRIGFNINNKIANATHCLYVILNTSSCFAMVLGEIHGKVWYMPNWL